MDLPKLGDSVLYWTDHDTLARGILAERVISPLTGNPKYRVVDFWRESSDPDAGKWLDIMRIERFN